jgi:hypothetical protein
MERRVIKIRDRFDVSHCTPSDFSSRRRAKGVIYFSRPKYLPDGVAVGGLAVGASWEWINLPSAEDSQTNLPFSQSLPVRATITTATIPHSWLCALRMAKSGCRSGGPEYITCQHVRVHARALLSWPN